MSARILRGREIQGDLGKITLGQCFFNNAEKHGEKICQIDANLDKSETYSSVKIRSVRLAIALQQKNVLSSDVVMTCSKNTLDNPIPILATLYLAAKTISLDPSFSVRSARHLISQVTPKIIFVEESAIDLIEESLNNTQLHPEIIVLGASDKYKTFASLLLPDRKENSFTPVEVDVNETGVMFFSSGSTGLPKAICYSHKNFLQIHNRKRKIGISGIAILHFSSFYWISCMSILTATFLNGGTRVFSQDVDGESILKMIEKYNILSMFMAPIQTYKLTNVKNSEKYNTSSLRIFSMGGTSISPEQFKRISDMFETADIIFIYAMTEVGVVSCFDPQFHRDLIKRKITSCSKVYMNTLVKVVNPDTNEILGPNQTGEIRVKSSSVMQGYYKLNSSECFDIDGFFKTGDLGYFDEDECFYVIGRLKEMFKYLSWHIVPNSIEAVLVEHPGVAEAVVFGVPRAEEGEVPAACVVLKENITIDKEDIEKFVAEKVADREKLRGGVYFVNSIPKTSSGKIIRKDVRTNMLKLIN